MVKTYKHISKRQLLLKEATSRGQYVDPLIMETAS